jgi:hypothetical protein
MWENSYEVKKKELSPVQIVGLYNNSYEAKLVYILPAVTT